MTLTKEGIVNQLMRKYCKYHYAAKKADPASEDFGRNMWMRQQIADTLLAYGIDVLTHYELNAMPPESEVQDA